MCALVRAYACVCALVRAWRPEEGTHCPVTFHLVPLRQSLLLSVELEFFGWVESPQASGVLFPLLSAVLE